MKKISVVTENQPGISTAIRNIMAKNHVNVESLKTQVIGNTGVVIMSVDKYDVALKGLRDASMNAISEGNLLIRIKDVPGALAEIAERLRAANINTQSFQIIARDGEYSIAAFSTERLAEARELVKDVLVS